MKSPTKAIRDAAATAAETSRTKWETQRQEHWQRDHLRTISCKISTDEHEAILKCCRIAHCTRYALLRLLITSYLDIMARKK